MSAESEGERSGFAFATTEVDEVLADAATRAVVIATRHDLHADLVVRALRAGKHVFVEKPLATTLEDLERVADCVASLGEQCPVLTVGFNRRFAPAVARLRAFFTGVRPLAISYRFAVPSLPAEHWVHDASVGGGRLIGEACHAIDACAAIAGSVPVRVFAESALAVGEAPVANDRVFISLRLSDGSVANVGYLAGGDRALPAERIEIFGGDRSAILTGWDELELWQGGACARERGGRDRGHAAEVRAFLDVISRGGPWPIPWDHLLATSEATLLADLSLRDGFAQTVGGLPRVAVPTAAE